MKKKTASSEKSTAKTAIHEAPKKVAKKTVKKAVSDASSEAPLAAAKSAKPAGKSNEKSAGKSAKTSKAVKKSSAAPAPSSKSEFRDSAPPVVAELDPVQEARKAKVAKPVMAEVMYESAGPTPIDEAALEADKAYSLPAEEILDGDLPDEEPMSKLKNTVSTKSLVPAEGLGGITSTDPLAIYLNDIRKYPVLTKEKELEIARKYFETKDPEAAQTLIKSNLRFVVKVAADYSRFGAKMIDLIQEGNVGLMHAVREYNPYKGARLITYAVWWIRGYIQEYLMRQYSMVRIGTTQNQRRLFYQLQKEKEALDAMGLQPNLALLSSRLGIPEDEIEQMSQRMSGRDISLDRPLDDDAGSSLMDLQRSTADMNLDDRIAHEEQIELLKKRIESLRPELSEREKIILDERILNDEPLTLQEIGEKHGITREAVRQMEARVLKKIKTRMESDS